MTNPDAITPDSALAGYPELGRILRLLERGQWRVNVYHDESGNVQSVRLSWYYPDGFAECIGILNNTDVTAIRTNPLDEVVWTKSGTLVDVVDTLLAIPVPASPLAPSLVIPTVRIDVPRFDGRPQ